MNLFARLGLRAKARLLAAAPLVLLAAGQTFQSTRTLENSLRDQYIQRAVSMAGFYEHMLKEYLDLNEMVRFLSDIDRLRRIHSEILDVRLYSLNKGALVPFRLESGTAATKALPPAPAQAAAACARGDWFSRDESLRGQSIVSVFYPITILGKQTGALEIRLSTEQRDQWIRSLVVEQTVFSLLVLLAAIGLSALATDRWIVRRIVRLENQIAAHGAGMSAPAPVDLAPDEIGALSRAFARMKEDTTRIQTQLLNSEKLTAIGRLSAGVAHEINNPLGIILGFAQSMRSRLKPDDPATLPVQSIAREAERCRDLVQSLLLFSRGSAAGQREELDMNAVVEEALALVKAHGDMTRVKVVRRFGPGLPRIRANKNQLQQVVVNLGSNAVDAMPQGGVLTVETSRAAGEQDAVVLRIADTGMGIPADIRSKIFDPFFTTKEVGKGTGLGLSLVLEIVQKHEGRVELKSEVGQGTTFIVTFPTEPVRRTAPPRPPRSR